MIKLKHLLKEELITEGTRWNVGVAMPNGKVTAVYGHYDGYPEYVGKLLKQHYRNPSVIKQLIKLGKQGISTLGKKIGKKHDFNMPYDEKQKLGYTTFYGRDRGEKGNMSSTFKNREEYAKNTGSDIEYSYVWSMKDKKWYYFDRSKKQKEL